MPARPRLALVGPTHLAVADLKAAIINATAGFVPHPANADDRAQNTRTETLINRLAEELTTAEAAL